MTCPWRHKHKPFHRKVEFTPLQAMVFEKLDAIVQASSLVELVNSFLRPYLNSSKGQITQETLNLIMFYHNHRRYKSGKRQGKAPIELLTGEALKADWVALVLQHIQETSPCPSLPSSAPLTLVPHGHEHPTSSQTPPGQALLEPMRSRLSHGHPWMLKPPKSPPLDSYRTLLRVQFPSGLTLPSSRDTCG